MALYATMQMVLAMRMHPLTGETEMKPERIRELVLATFAEVRRVYSEALKAANDEPADVKTKREAAHKAASAKFTALYETALSQKTPASWALAYRDMTATKSPAGGDKEMLKEVKEMHDKYRESLDAFAYTHPILSDWDKAISRLETKGRPAGSTNKPKETKAEAPAS